MLPLRIFSVTRVQWLVTEAADGIGYPYEETRDVREADVVAFDVPLAVSIPTAIGTHAAVIEFSPHAGDQPHHAGDPPAKARFLLGGKDVTAEFPLEKIPRSLGRSEVLRVRRFLLEVLATRPIRGVQEDWRATSEILELRLTLLLDDHERLVRDLADALCDRDSAEARVAVLEAQLVALRAERDRTARKVTDPGVLLGIAMVVATVLAPIGAVILDRQLSHPAKEVVNVALDLKAQCLEADPIAPLPRK